MQTTQKAKIIKGVGGLYYALVTDSASAYYREVIRCRARGALKRNNATLLVGDNVTLVCDDSNDAIGNDDGKFVIDGIDERSNALIRPPMANLDYLFVTMAAASPTPILATVDKLISIAEHNKIEPIIVITKCELDSANASALCNDYRSCGFTVFCLSAKENTGIEPIEEFIAYEELLVKADDVWHTAKDRN